MHNNKWYGWIQPDKLKSAKPSSTNDWTWHDQSGVSDYPLPSSFIQKEEDTPPWTSFSGISKKIYVKIWGGNGRLNRNDNQNWYMKVPKPLIIANNSYPNSSNWKWWKKIIHKIQSMKDGQHYGLIIDQLPVMTRLKISTIQFRYDGGIVKGQAAVSMVLLVKIHEAGQKSCWGYHNSVSWLCLLPCIQQAIIPFPILNLICSL